MQLRHAVHANVFFPHALCWTIMRISIYILPVFAPVAQTMAEREAWRLAKEHGLDLVAILPNFVLGPALSSRSDGLSMGFLKARR
jgi:hypothetical protein